MLTANFVAMSGNQVISVSLYTLTAILSVPVVLAFSISSLLFISEMFGTSDSKEDDQEAPDGVKDEGKEDSENPSDAESTANTRMMFRTSLLSFLILLVLAAFRGAATLLA